MSIKNLCAASAVLMLTSCASIVSGTTQTLHINSTPTGAKCELFRDESKSVKNVVIATVNPTPGDALVEKTKYAITAKCNKAGYEEGTMVLESGNEGSTLGNIILGGGVGWAVDSARGADNKYPLYTNVPLVKK